MNHIDLLIQLKGPTEKWKTLPLVCIFFVLSFQLMYPIESRSEGDFDVAITPSRTEGVAPLSVFFDVTSTPVISNGKYVNSTCAWDFDTTGVDQGAKYSHGSGFVAAHVFEKPGSYRVRVDIYTPSGQHGYETVQIDVSDFSGTTYYVAENGDDENNSGLSMNSPFKTVSYALTGPHVGPNTSILFRNGDIFTISKMVIISNTTGPIIIGGYSDPDNPSPAKPIIHTTAVNSDWATLYFSNSSDIRIMDIATRATNESSATPRYPFGISMDNSTTHILKYRTEEYQNGGMAMSPCGRFNTVAECSFHNTTQTGYCSGGDDNSGNALIGNNVYDKNQIDPDNEEHIFRLQGGNKYYIAHNTFGPDVAVNYDTLTIRGDSDQVVIYNNIIMDYVTGIWPQNRNSAEEYQHHCIIDSNLFIGGENNGLAIGLHSKDIVIRNNIFYNYHTAIGVANDTVVGPSQRVKIYNNTMINPVQNDGSYRFATIDAECFDVEFKNNVMLDVAGTTPLYTLLFDLRNSSQLNGSSGYNVLFGQGWTESSGLFDGLNLTAWRTASGNDLHTVIADPHLRNIDIGNPQNPNFCRPSQESKALIDTGAFTAAALDFHGNLRDQQRDIGAVEFNSKMSIPYIMQLILSE